ncbi:unnamed protein product [Lactuca saligna]|uniref:Uncharacterized protein n=1 Tax=Lactuca saligna TaxID=75948 RepID=A0AA35ZA71_LACSI|nr:unnamed protein product [Lactuca saligna]
MVLEDSDQEITGSFQYFMPPPTASFLFEEDSNDDVDPNTPLTHAQKELIEATNTKVDFVIIVVKDLSKKFRKGKMSIISDEKINLILTKEERKAQVVRHNELDDLKALNKTLDQLEAEKQNSVKIEPSKRTLFPEWTIDRMDKDTIKKVNPFWLEPNTSFW